MTDNAPISGHADEFVEDAPGAVRIVGLECLQRQRECLSVAFEKHSGAGCRGTRTIGGPRHAAILTDLWP